MQKRVQVRYSGHVQGVGFRYTARSIAQAHHVAGFVKNLSDGGVELVLEGDEKVLKEYLRDIREQMNFARFEESIAWREPVGGFSGFEIRF